MQHRNNDAAGRNAGGKKTPEVYEPWYEAMGPRIPREEILAQIWESPELTEQFERLSLERREQFLDACSGARGLMVCYDPFFKYVFSPMTRRDRLSRFLSSLLGRQVRVKNILPNEGGRIAARSPYIIMDIVVELEDHSYANTEIQREPYQFPGERAASYSSDLVLRQYASLGKSGGENALARYKRMQNVYTIVIMQKSSSEFHKHPETYVHHGKQVFDTGLDLPLLQEYIFVPLDLFREKLHNKNIETELEAWLGFLAFDDLERIWEISHFDPIFEGMYHDLSEYRRDAGEVLGVFSEILYEMDVEAAQYQSNEVKKQLKEQIAALEEEKERLEEANVQLKEKKVQLEETNIQLKEKKVQLEEANVQLEEANVQLEEEKGRLEEANVQLDEENAQLKRQLTRMAQLEAELERLRGNREEGAR